MGCRPGGLGGKAPGTPPIARPGEPCLHPPRPFPPQHARPMPLTSGRRNVEERCLLDCELGSLEPHPFPRIVLVVAALLGGHQHRRALVLDLGSGAAGRRGGCGCEARCSRRPARGARHPCTNWDAGKKAGRPEHAARHQANAAQPLASLHAQKHVRTNLVDGGGRFGGRCAFQLFPRRLKQRERGRVGVHKGGVAHEPVCRGGGGPGRRPPIPSPPPLEAPTPPCMSPQPMSRRCKARALQLPRLGLWGHPSSHRTHVSCDSRPKGASHSHSATLDGSRSSGTSDLQGCAAGH